MEAPTRSRILLPSALHLRNYRCFAGEHSIELRPLTLLYGRNNAGKSALLRLLPLIGDSLETSAASPLNMRSPAIRGASFTDLLWHGIEEEEERTIGLGLSWPAPSPVRRVEYDIQWMGEWRRLLLRRFSIWTNNAVPALLAEWRVRHEDKNSRSHTFEITENDSPIVERQLAFQGLRPTTDAESSLYLEKAEMQLASIAGSFQWLDAHRRPSLDRVQHFPGTPVNKMKPNGEDAPDLLVSNDGLLEVVSKWYKEAVNRELRVQEVSGAGFRLLLRNLSRAELDIDLADTGEGLVQALPVLTALALQEQANEGTPSILAVEEPESHLHPDLQLDLAKRICEVASKDRGIAIFETHSEHIMLGVQLEVARGNLHPDSVVMYWVRQLEGGQALCERVVFDESGRPEGNLPPRPFSHDTETARLILEERKKRGRQ